MQYEVDILVILVLKVNVFSIINFFFQYTLIKENNFCYKCKFKFLFLELECFTFIFKLFKAIFTRFTKCKGINYYFS